MLIIGMNRDEIQKQVSSDLQKADLWIRQHHGPLRYWLDRAKENEAKSISWKSPNGNPWEIVLVKENNEACLVHYTWIESKFGRYVIKPQLTRKGIIMLIFLPHFFKRYRERMKLGKKPTTMQVVKRFMKKNRTANATTDDGMREEMAFADGVGLGVWTGMRQRLLKTFITYEMAYGDQADRLHESNARRKKFSGKIGYYTDEIAQEMKTFGLSDEEILKQYEDSEFLNQD